MNYREQDDLNCCINCKYSKHNEISEICTNEESTECRCIVYPSGICDLFVIDD